MRKWIVLLLFCTLSFDAFAQQIVSERQESWGFVSFVSKVVIAITLLTTIYCGSIALIAYRNELTLANFWSLWGVGGSGKKTKTKKKKRRRRRTHQTEAEKQAEAEEDALEKAEQEAERQAEAEREAKLQIEAETEGTPKKRHRSSKHAKKKTSRFEKNKKTYRTLFIISALIFFGTFFLYLLAERERAKEDVPTVIPPELMW